MHQTILWQLFGYSLGIFFRQANNNEEAETYYKKAVALRPDVSCTRLYKLKINS